MTSSAQIFFPVTAVLSLWAIVLDSTALLLLPSRTRGLHGHSFLFYKRNHLFGTLVYKLWLRDIKEDSSKADKNFMHRYKVFSLFLRWRRVQRGVWGQDHGGVELLPWHPFLKVNNLVSWLVGVDFRGGSALQFGKCRQACREETN